ncbi:hypothetical protein [Klebsiella pneumoniae]|uniref:hypothetical protein n=1 Tax=Klebsiella pneumoniae TaxID=573 RepID=UPI00203D889E|nr:hypothetical protein [Klebsiella pneumoniae]USB65903.1 hypothetical protein KU669_03300 [Klebsiella pneumoniae]
MSGEFKGTPGPWEWWTSNSFLRLSSKAAGKDGGVIDSTVMRDGHPTLIVKKEDMALIEAAPEMLESLQEMVGFLGVMVKDPENCPEIIKSRAAIAKALGEKQ